MLGVLIKTIGEVSLHSKVGLTSKYRYDIPVDGLGFPYLPLRKILAEMGMPDLDIQLGFAHPKGYLGMIREANVLETQFPNDREFVQELYINERFYVEEDCHVRSLKGNQLFYAPLYCRQEDMAAFQLFLSGISHIGITNKDISGEVQLSISPMEDEHANPFPINNKRVYSGLKYSVHLLTPTSIHAPFEDTVKTHLFIPGRDMRIALSEYCEEPGLSNALRQMTFSNAYISDSGVRFFPVPLSMSVVKLDKEELRCRLSTGKDIQRVEQDVTLYNVFTDNFQCRSMRYTKPETERIVSYTGEMYDAICPGQAFCGVVYGSDREIRLLAEHIQSNPRISIGALAEEGYGEAYIDVSGMEEDDMDKEILTRQFDVVCLSHTVLLDDNGIPSCRPQSLLSEIERLLGLDGKLEIVAAYTDYYNDYGYHYNWHQEGPVVRCLRAGSVIRVATHDGTPVDISRVVHTFIGENQRDGYGEIMVVPAINQYYRSAEKISPAKYSMDISISYPNLYMGATLVRAMLSLKLKKYVKALAALDSEEYENNIPADTLVPTEILSELKNIYDPDIDIRVVEKWYKEGLEEYV